MKYFSLFFSIIVLSFILQISRVEAAKMLMNAPISASPNRSAVVVQLLLDTEQDAVSGVSGTFSFPSDLFDVKTISTANGVVSLWAIQPHVSTENYFDGRTRVTFEGIMPGGFSGVLSPYYKGARPGLLFTIALTPKHQGETDFLLDGVEIRSFDVSATLLSTESSVSHISIPALTGKPSFDTPPMSNVQSSTLTTTLARSPLVSNNAWYLIVHEDEVLHSIDHIEVAETNEYDPEHVPPHLWRTVHIPYVLRYQSLNTYIHTKVVYTNNTYATQTIAPVENSSRISYLSRILLCIILLIALLSRYGKNLLHIFYKNYRKRT